MVRNRERGAQCGAAPFMSHFRHREATQSGSLPRIPHVRTDERNKNDGARAGVVVGPSLKMHAGFPDGDLRTCRRQAVGTRGWPESRSASSSFVGLRRVYRAPFSRPPAFCLHARRLSLLFGKTGKIESIKIEYFHFPRLFNRPLQCISKILHNLSYSFSVVSLFLIN